MGNLLAVLRALPHTWAHHVWRRNCREVRGDAWHDDTTGLQAVLHDGVILPAGVFVISETLVLDGDGMRLTGSSVASTSLRHGGEGKHD